MRTNSDNLAAENASSGAPNLVNKTDCAWYLSYVFVGAQRIVFVKVERKEALHSIVLLNTRVEAVRRTSEKPVWDLLMNILRTVQFSAVKADINLAVNSQQATVRIDGTAPIN